MEPQESYLPKLTYLQGQRVDLNPELSDSSWDHRVTD